MIRHHMIENADKLRAAALQRRNAGKHTGKTAAGWNVKRPDPAKGSWDYVVAVAKAHVQSVAAEAQEDYRRAVFPERYADVTLDDVIAANEAAATASLLATF